MSSPGCGYFSFSTPKPDFPFKWCDYRSSQYKAGRRLRCTPSSLHSPSRLRLQSPNAQRELSEEANGRQSRKDPVICGFTENQCRSSPQRKSREQDFWEKATWPMVGDNNLCRIHQSEIPFTIRDFCALYIVSDMYYIVIHKCFMVTHMKYLIIIFINISPSHCHLIHKLLPEQESQFILSGKQFCSMKI